MVSLCSSLSLAIILSSQRTAVLEVPRCLNMDWKEQETGDAGFSSRYVDSQM